MTAIEQQKAAQQLKSAKNQNQPRLADYILETTKNNQKSAKIG